MENENKNINNDMENELYIFIVENHNQSGGGSFISNRNFRFFSQIALKRCSPIIKINPEVLCLNIFSRVIKILFKFSFFEVVNFIRVIYKCKVKCTIHIWFDRSNYGWLILLLKLIFFYKPLVFHTYFHNDEVKYLKDKIKDSSFVKRLLLLLNVRFEQYLCLYLSSKLYFISNLEQCSLGSGKGFFLPPTWNSFPKIDKNEDIDITIPNKPYILLVGSAFFANIRGFQWFIDECAPHLDVNTIVVGSGMSSFFKSNGNVIVYDYVDDLSSFYFNSTAVIVPIFDGAGIKIKALEALLYEKNVVITSSAFKGLDYVTDDFPDFFHIANSAMDFICVINELSKSGVGIKALSKRKLSDEFYLNAYEHYLLS